MKPIFWQIKNHLEVKNHKLFFGKIDCQELAKKYGTPLYVYNFERVKENINRLKRAFEKVKLNFKIFYAEKANNSLALLKFLKNKVNGIDVASPFEIKLAQKAGFLPKDLMLTSPAIADKDLKEILAQEILINVDSFSQLKQVGRLKKYSQIGLRINPLIEVGAHSHIRSAGKFSKFGILPEKAIEATKRAKSYGLKVIGLHCMAGSNWLAKDLKNFEKITKIMAETAKKLQILTNLVYLNFGGGLGIPHQPKDKAFSEKDLLKYAKLIKKAIKESKVREARIEPGRFLIGDAGILLTKIIHLSQNEKPINVAILDAGYNIFQRPFIYGAYHHIVCCSKADFKKGKKYLLAGNLCEGGDVFNVSKRELREMPDLKEGEILAILNAGAYGFSMSSNFNLRERAAEVAIIKGKDKLIRKRENFEDLIKNQI
jgi:diaminopimelate decarboxylase